MEPGGTGRVLRRVLDGCRRNLDLPVQVAVRQDHQRGHDLGDARDRSRLSSPRLHMRLPDVTFTRSPATATTPAGAARSAADSLPATGDA